MKRLLGIDRLTWKIGLTVSVLVVFALAVGFHLTYLVYRRHMLAAARDHAESEAKLVRLALSHQMLESDDRSLVRGMVQGFARDTRVERVMVLDHEGLVRHSSDPTIRERHFQLDDPTCQVCHRHAPEERDRSTVLELEGGALLRSVQPIPNLAPCHRCHDPGQRMNGVLIVDVPLGATFARIESSVQSLALGTAFVGLVLIGGIGVAFRRFLLRRLYRFEGAARAIALGDLTQRVPVEGNDALTRLEVQFNGMADSLGATLERLEAERDRLRRVMNGVDDGMVVLDARLQVTAVNDAFVKRFPGIGANPAGRACRDLLHGAGVDCDTEDCPSHQCFQTGEVRTAIRTRVDASGALRHEEIRASPLLRPDGTVGRVVEVWRDITDRRSAEARLAEYQRMASVGMLASGFSHEINTPLASIGTCLGAIERICGAAAAPAATCEQVRGYTQIALEQVRRCGGITQQFLGFARGRPPDREIFDLSAAAELVARLVGPTARVAGVTLEVEACPSLPPIAASPAAVQQVLLNLLMNAVEASHAGQKVKVSFQVGETIEVLVSDEGVGLQPEDIARVFEPFFSLRPQGTGLGLFVSINLARGWGGDLRVLSSRPGGGTTFAATFPRRPIEGAPA